MKTKINFLLLVVMALMLAFGACNTQTKKSTPTEQGETTEKVTYTCPMHAEVISDKPGKCPKCHMDLVEKSTSNDTIQMNPDTMHEHSH
jgi:hypothetical protein